MGNKHSKVKEEDEDPHKTLNIPKSATEQQIRSAYKKLVRRHHPDSAEEPNRKKYYTITSAYKKLTDKTPPKPQQFLNLDLYTENYFKNNNNFIESADNLFRMIVEAERIENPSVPVFTGNSKKFYDFFKSFKTRIKFVADKDENRTRQKLYNEKIRKITAIVAKYDERLNIVIENVGIGDYEVKKKIRVKKVKNEFFCDACKRGFRSKSTYEVHLKSKKHIQKENELLDKDKVDFNIGGDNQNLKYGEDKKKLNIGGDNQNLKYDVDKNDLNIGGDNQNFKYDHESYEGDYKKDLNIGDDYQNFKYDDDKKDYNEEIKLDNEFNCNKIGYQQKTKLDNDYECDKMDFQQKNIHNVGQEEMKNNYKQKIKSSDDSEEDLKDENIKSVVKKLQKIKIGVKKVVNKFKNGKKKKGDSLNREPIHFLKCSICGVVLESRTCLVIHLRENHS